MRDRAGPERNVDLRIEREQALSLRLRVAAADGDDRARPLALQLRCVPHMGGEARVGLLADRARVEHDHVGLVLRRRLAQAELLEQALDPLGVVSVHLAAEGRDVVAFQQMFPYLLEGSSMTRKGLRLIAYVRVSDVRGREGPGFISPDEQREKCRAFATAMGHTIVDEAEEFDRSGRDM